MLEEIRKNSIRRWESYQNSPLGKLHPPSLNSTWKLLLPKRFRELRALAIASWFLPEWLSWEIRIQLYDFIYSLDFQTGGLEQSSALRLLVRDQRIMISYLKNFINLRELFGQILKGDLDSALRTLSLKEEGGPVRRKIRRKGYRDKGTWRPPHLWRESSDFSFNLEQSNLEKKRLLIDLVTQLYSYKL